MLALRFKGSAQIGSGRHRELVPVAEGVGCRLSKDEDQLHEVSGLHVGVQGQRGSSRVIEEDTHGAPPLCAPVHRRVSGQLPDRRFKIALAARGALLNLAGGGAHVGGLCGVLAESNGTVPVVKASPAARRGPELSACHRAVDTDRYRGTSGVTVCNQVAAKLHLL